MRKIKIEADQMGTHYVFDSTGSKEILVTENEYKWLAKLFIEYEIAQNFLREKYGD